MTDGNMILRQFELEDKIAGQRLEIKRLNGVLSNFIEALRFYIDTESDEVKEDKGHKARLALTNTGGYPKDTKRLDWIEVQAAWKRRSLTVATCVPSSDTPWYEVREWIDGEEHTIGDGMSIREAITNAMNAESVNHGSHSKESSLIKEVQEWAAEKFQRATAGTIQLHLREEAGELYDQLLYWERHQYPVNPDVVWPTMLEEFADVFLVMCHLANKRNFDLLDVIRHKFNIVKHQRFEYDEQRGHYKRVKEEVDYGQQGDLSA